MSFILLDTFPSCYDVLRKTLRALRSTFAPKLAEVFVHPLLPSNVTQKPNMPITVTLPNTKCHKIRSEVIELLHSEGRTDRQKCDVYRCIFVPVLNAPKMV
jgi:hypothetical protein